MKKAGRPIIILIVALMTGAGINNVYSEYENNKPVVWNYTGEDFKINDSTTFKSEKIVQHEVKKYRNRSISKKDTLNIYVHHLAVPATTSIAGVMKYHVNSHGWAAIGYHSGIGENGDIYLFNDLETISYHTKGQNTKGISIVLWGDYTNLPPTKAQLKSLELLITSISEIVTINKVSAHRYAPGANTKCPGDSALLILEQQDYFKK